MANWNTFYVHNGGVPVTGLAPTWKYLKDVVDGTNYASQPTIIEVGGGWYRYQIALDDFRHLVGVIDAGDTVGDTSRYISQEIRYSDLAQKDNVDINIIPVYDEDSVSITFFVFMLACGRLVEDNLTSATLNIYNEDHELQFTLTTSSFTNGVGVMSQGSPTLTKNHCYYAIADIVNSMGTYRSAETYIVLE